MSKTGYPSFDATVDKTNHVLREIEEAYGWPKERRNQSYAALRTVMHTLRDRLVPEEAVQLAAQLPMLIRGIYYEGWDPSATPVKMNKEEFLDRIRSQFPYSVEGGMQRLVQTVLGALRSYITEGEWADIKSSVPRELESVLP
jgi:uncharacterized protein (DUF2267 family)